jgi:hypothetical protein
VLQVDLVRTFYRIIRTDSATLWDFTSNEARRRQPRRPLRSAERRLWRGLSHFDTLAAANAAARQTPALGQYIAEVVLPDDTDIQVEQTGRAGHYTLWGSPGRLLGYVRRIEPVEG